MFCHFKFEVCTKNVSAQSRKLLLYLSSLSCLSFLFQHNLRCKVFKQLVSILITMKAIVQSDVRILLFISSIQTSLKFPFY